MANTLVIKWHDCAPSEGGGTKLIAKPGDNAAPVFEQHFPKGHLKEARDKAIALLEATMPKFDDLESLPRVNV